jgi:hypothetical protein
MRRPFPTSILIPALAAACLACGAAQDRGLSIDPKDLLGRGDYAAARIAAEARGGDTPSDRAVIALSLIAEHADREAAVRAVEALVAGGDRALAVRSAAEMLALYSSAPACADDEHSLLAAEIALGALGLGPIAAARPPAGARSAADFALAVSIIERLRFGLAGSDQLASARVLAVWNGCYALLDPSMKGATDFDSWLLYTNVGGLAVMVAEAAPASDLARALLASSVAAVEANPTLAVAVRCDLASPFDAQRVALTHERDLLGRLERAVAPAVGCSRGTYAPRPPK